MGKIIYFDYAALIVLSMLIISTFVRGMTKGRRNRCFLLLLFTSALSVLTDIVTVGLDRTGVGYETTKYIFNTLYLFFHGITTPVYIAYLVAQTDTWHRMNRSLALRLALSLPILLISALLFLNPFCHVMFYLDENGVYIRGPFFLLLYLVAGFYIVFGTVYLFRYRSLFSTGRFLSMLLIFPLGLIAAVIQFFFPQYIIEMFMNSVGILFISMLIQRPEEIIDIVTGLKKHSAYVTDIRQTFTNGKPIEIIMVNIANYRSLSDMLGYDNLSEMLHKIAVQLESLNRSRGLEGELYYLGLGKFRIVVSEKYFPLVRGTAEIINTELKKEFSLKKMELNLVSHVCIARCPEDIDNVDSLLFFGDCLNEEAYTGEVRYVSDLYNKEYYDVMKDMDGILERALSDRRFSVYYQPIYSISEKRFHSAEALLRLYDEKYGFISPELFIPAAEKNGTIHKIGAYVLEEVCRFIASEEFQTLKIDYIEINLSVAQCMQNNLSSEVLSVLRKYKIMPDQINLEITETAASYSQNTMIENLNALNAAGISFSLDDFGTGYSNMRRIASLPLYIVKLDKSFTRMDENPKLLVILENTIRMIKEMNMKIVVEGIESEDAARQFSNLQCDYIQGYYYSKPLPKEEFISFINQSLATV